MCKLCFSKSFISVEDMLNNFSIYILLSVTTQYIDTDIALLICEQVRTFLGLFSFFSE